MNTPGSSFDYPRLPLNAAWECFSLLNLNKYDSREVAEQTDGEFNSRVSYSRIHNALKKVDMIGPPKFPYANYDAQASIVFHKYAALTLEQARDPDFWRWLTFSHELSLKIIKQRYMNKDGYIPSSRYCLKVMLDAYFPYLWLRSNSVMCRKRNNEHQYVYQKKLPDADFWISHVLRVEYGCYPCVVRSFIDYILKHKLPRGSKQVVGFRDLSKEISRRNATTNLELMSKTQATTMINKLWKSRKEWSTKLVNFDDDS